MLKRQLQQAIFGLSFSAIMLGCSNSGVNALDSETAKSQQVEQPNIVFFFVDDMGWTARTSKNPIYETPNIEALAQSGMDFTNMYIPTPTCSPSRAALLTGQHPARIRMVRHIPHKPQYGFDKYGHTEHKWHFWEKDPIQIPSINWLDTNYTTYAEVLSKAGYYNQFMGKWHLGDEPYHPVKQGFDNQIGTTNWGHPNSYYPPYFKNTDVLKDETGYLTDTLTEKAVDFINGYDKKQPFMLSLWYYAVHTPFDGRKDKVAYFLKKGLSKQEAHLAALVSSIDDSVGEVRNALKKAGLDKNTLVMFLSDQGGALSNAPLRGGKKVDTLYEGGSRVPFIASWPGHIPTGTTNNSLLQSIDILPTLMDITGATTQQKLDGVSIKSALLDNQIITREKPLIGYRGYEDLYASVRLGDWKLLAHRSGELYLYNIKEDESEQNDVAKQNPKIVNQLKAELIDWENSLDLQAYSGVQ